MTPAIFKNASLWFKLFKLAEPPEHVWGRAPFAEKAYEHRAVLKAVVDGKKHTIQFTVLRDEYDNLALDIVLIRGRCQTAFFVTYERSLDERGDRCDNEYWGSRHLTFISDKYLSQILPNFDSVTEANEAEHMVMMFILSVEGVMA